MNSVFLLRVSAMIGLAVTTTVSAQEREADVCAFLEKAGAYALNDFQDIMIPTEDPEFFTSSYEPSGVSDDEGCLIILGEDGDPPSFLCEWAPDGNIQQAYRQLLSNVESCLQGANGRDRSDNNSSRQSRSWRYPVGDELVRVSVALRNSEVKLYISPDR